MQGDFDGVAVPMQVSTLAFMVGNTVPCIKFKASGNLHGDFSVPEGGAL